MSRSVASAEDRRQGRHGIVVPVIEYRLATTVLDCEQAPATDLAALYHDRWEIGVSRQGQIVQPVRAQQTQQQTQAS